MMGPMGDQLLERGAAPFGDDDDLDLDDDLDPQRPGRPYDSDGRPVVSRVAARIVRRPRGWLDAPWPTDRVIRVLTTVLLLGGATYAAVMAIHPDLVFTNNTPTGGDMGAHVMGPAFLRDHLLPHFAAQRVEQLLVRRASPCTASTWSCRR